MVNPDIVEKLKTQMGSLGTRDVKDYSTWLPCDVVFDAILEIERLRLENTELKERLTEMSWIISPDRMGQ